MADPPYGDLLTPPHASGVVGGGEGTLARPPLDPYQVAHTVQNLHLYTVVVRLSVSLRKTFSFPSNRAYRMQN